MINSAFEEVINEARNGTIYLEDEFGTYPVNVSFNLVKDKPVEGTINIYIRNVEKFNTVLKEYVSTALDFYFMDANYQNIKEIITYAFVNMSLEEMNCLEDYLLKRIGFYKNKFMSISRKIDTSIGTINCSIAKQSIKQETPFYFESYITENDSVYALPRISFGMNGDICEIYAIQNKDKNMNKDENYSTRVHKVFSTLNSGVKKYRNVTPSFVVTLILFISLLKENGINKIKVVTPLPIRRDTKLTCMQLRLDKISSGGTLTPESIKMLKDIEEKTMRDIYNSTIKFLNCFNRLSCCFEDIYFSELDNQMIINTLDLSINNDFMNEILGREIGNNGKISKHSSC